MDFQKCSMSQEGILTNLEKGMKSEVRARDLCQELLGVIDDENDKKIIEKILKDEERHIKMTEELMMITKAFYGAK
jgi:rubrerythrin